jgi:hypothetical protein
MRCWVRDGATRSREDALGSTQADFTILVFDSPPSVRRSISISFRTRGVSPV